MPIKMSSLYISSVCHFSSVWQILPQGREVAGKLALAFSLLVDRGLGAQCVPTWEDPETQISSFRWMILPEGVVGHHVSAGNGCLS